MKPGWYLPVIIVTLYASASASLRPVEPISVEEAKQRLEERQRQRREHPEAPPKPVPVARPKSTVKALALKDGAPEAVREWFARLPAIQAAHVNSLETEVTALEAQIRTVETQPLPKVRVGGGAFGTSEYRPDESAARARSQRAKVMRQTLREMKRRVEHARQDRTFIDIRPLKLEADGFGTVTSARVTQIIDGQNMLAIVNDKQVWLLGVSTHGLVDGSTVPLDRTMAVSRTRKSSSRTMYVLEPLDLKEWLTVVDQDPNDVAPAGQLAAQRRLAAQRPKPEASRVASNAVADAIRDHRLIREMTPDEAMQAMGGKPQRQTDTDEGMTMAWDSRQGVTAGTYQPRTGKASGGSAGYVVRRVTAWFEDGRLTRFEDEKVR